MTMSADLGRTWKQVSMASYKLLFQYFRGETEENCKKPTSKPDYAPRAVIK
jgi:hypothetical protein